MRLTMLATGLALLAGCGSAPKPTDLATAAVDSLYRVRHPFRSSGAPTAAQLATISPFLSDELKTLLVRADSLRSAESQAAPNEKPSFAEGDLFSSMFEGPTAFGLNPGEASGGPDSYKVPIHFWSSGANPPVKWVDTAVVSNAGGKYVVSDVIYGGTWDFANKGTLVTSLNFSFVPQTPRDSGN